jgi:hypothetical protein
MISLLTAYVLAAGEASWYWWTFWVVLAFVEFIKFIERN